MSNRIYDPSILIDDVEYKCKANSVRLGPTGDRFSYCGSEFEFSAEILLAYGAAETWNLLEALEDTIVDVVLKPADATVAAGNPSATFQIMMPAIDFISSDGRGNRQSITLTAMTEAPPVYSTGA